MVTGLQILALACSNEYSWPVHRPSVFKSDDDKDVGGTQGVSVPANAPHPTRQQGTDLWHPSSSCFVQTESTIERHEEVTWSTDGLPDGYSSSILTYKTSPYTGHNPEPFDIPLDEESRLPRDRRIIKRPDNSHPKQGHRRSTTGASVSLALTSIIEPSIWARRPDEHWPSAFNVGPAPILALNQSRFEPLPETRVRLNWTTNHMPRDTVIPSSIPTIPSEYTGDDMEEQEQRTDDDRIVEDDDLQHISSFLGLEDDERFDLHGLSEEDSDKEEEDEDYTTASEYSEYESTGSGIGWYDGESFSSSESPRTSPSPTLSPSLGPVLKARPASPPHPRLLEGVSGADISLAMAIERALKRSCRGELLY